MYTAVRKPLSVNIIQCSNSSCSGILICLEPERPGTYGQTYVGLGKSVHLKRKSPVLENVRSFF